MTDCEFLLRTRLKGPEFGPSGLGPLIENCSLTGRVCPVVGGPPTQCTRRTWAMDYIAKQGARQEIAPKGPE